MPKLEFKLTEFDMNITWHGGRFFQIAVQKEKNDNVNIAIDCHPKIKLSRTKADILLLTEKEEDLSNDSDGFFIVSSPGEYEIKDVFIKGVSRNNGKIFYFIEAEGITLCHLGSFNEKELSLEQQEAINNVDILMIPVGGGSSLGPKEASQIVSQIEPRVVIPMNYRTKSCGGGEIQKTKEKLESVDEFLKIMGIKNDKEELSRLSIKSRDFSPEEKMKIIILECR